MKIWAYNAKKTRHVQALPVRARLLFVSMTMTGLLASSLLYANDFQNQYDYPSSTVRILGGEINSTISKSANRITKGFNIEQQNGTKSALSKSLAIPLSSAGSMSSIADLIAGRAEFAIVSADVANELYRDPEKWGMEGITERVRLVTAVAPSLLHVVVRKKKRRKLTLAHFKQKTISIGFHAAMLDYSMSELLHTYGIDLRGTNISHYPTAQAIHLLDENKLDAVFILDQAPSELVSQLLKSDLYTLLPVHSEFMLKEKHTSVAHGLNEVKASFYPGLDNDFVTVLQDNYLLVHRALPDATVRSIKALSDDFNSEIRSLIPLHESLLTGKIHSSAKLQTDVTSADVTNADVANADVTNADVTKAGVTSTEASSEKGTTTDVLSVETGEQP